MQIQISTCQYQLTRAYSVCIEVREAWKWAKKCSNIAAAATVKRKVKQWNNSKKWPHSTPLFRTRGTFTGQRKNNLAWNWALNSREWELSFPCWVCVCVVQELSLLVVYYDGSVLIKHITYRRTERQPLRWWRVDWREPSDIYSADCQNNKHLKNRHYI